LFFDKNKKNLIKKGKKKKMIDSEIESQYKESMIDLFDDSPTNNSYYYTKIPKNNSIQKKGNAIYMNKESSLSLSSTKLKIENTSKYLFFYKKEN
jgi:hypothetical protein